MVYFIMDNFVYGLTKKQTSPTSPLGYKSKTDPSGAIDRPVNPIKKLVANGATFVARTHAAYPAHMIEMMEKAMDHDGFAVIECLSECVEFYPGAFDAAIQRKGGTFKLVDPSHDVTDEYAAYRLADEPWPGVFGVFYQAKGVPTKNRLEKQLVDNARTKLNNPTDIELLQKTLDRLK
jgi:2-oxoglutarate ferredoxin oxidoreductase subunit beta